MEIRLDFGYIIFDVPTFWLVTSRAQLGLLHTQSAVLESIIRHKIHKQAQAFLVSKAYPPACTYNTRANFLSMTSKVYKTERESGCQSSDGIPRVSHTAMCFHVATWYYSLYDWFGISSPLRFCCKLFLLLSMLLHLHWILRRIYDLPK